MVNSRSCNLEVRCFWVRVDSFCEYRFPKCSVQMFGSWMAMCLVVLDLSKFLSLHQMKSEQMSRSCSPHECCGAGLHTGQDCLYSM